MIPFCGKIFAAADYEISGRGCCKIVSDHVLSIIFCSNLQIISQNLVGKSAGSLFCSSSCRIYRSIYGFMNTAGEVYLKILPYKTPKGKRNGTLPVNTGPQGYFSHLRQFPYLFGRTFQAGDIGSFAAYVPAGVLLSCGKHSSRFGYFLRPGKRELCRMWRTSDHGKLTEDKDG